ncbi:MAG TPA: hypothetical protein VMH32_13175 [Burkholderiales bacterium]|nr:hypothetical protein [Burkholderiales bacterium]
MRTASVAIAIAASVLTLAACGGGKTLKPADQAGIGSVSVAATVKVVDQPTVVGSEAGLSALFGAAGAAATAESQKSAGKSFADYLAASGIDVGDIVRQQFTDKLRSDPIYGPRLSADGSYHFVLEVRSYGINKTTMVSSEWGPNLGVYYKLVSPDGKVLADDFATTWFSDVPKFTMEEIKANPQVLKRAFETAAAIVSAKLLKT